MAKQFMIYYKRGTGTFVVTEPRPWARENQHHFPGIDFKKNHPKTDTIQNYLIENFNFTVGHNDDQISVIFNLDPNLDL
ncbi:hypothetical protein AAFH68_16720 [Flavobacterium sp. CGRL1]